MPSRSQVSGFAVSSILAGAVLVYAGIRGINLGSALQAVVQGKSPATVKPTQQIPGLATGETDSSSSSGSTSTSATVPGVQASALPSAGTYSNAQLRALWIQAGGDPTKAATAACIGGHESSGEPGAISNNPDGGKNVGIWQLDTKGKGAGYSILELQNALNNARVTVFASRNGTDWSAWATAPLCGV